MGKSRKPNANVKLLQNVARGDSFVISGLLTSLTQKMKGHLLAMGLDKRDVEEVVLDSMAFFVEKVRAGEYSDQGIDVIHYLSKVAKFRAYYYLRNKGPEFQQIREDLPVSKSETTELLNWELVESGLKMIGEKHRRLIELTYFEGFSDREIDEQNLSGFNGVNSIKSQRYKALGKLKKAIEKIEFSKSDR
ncbi:MAG: hypothetical protein EA409_10370 [Saprospirales bacterium]|nr:MAG: hypothetical protein EA409_10370 [Saprospirales bacterium]